MQKVPDVTAPKDPRKRAAYLARERKRGKRPDRMRARNTAAAAALRTKNPALPPYTPRGPSGDHAVDDPPLQLAEGQELKAQTTHVNADGTLRSRYDKSQIARNPAEYLTVPASHHITKTTTRVDADGRVGMQYITSTPDAALHEAEILAAWARHASLYAGLAGTAPPVDAATLDCDRINLIPIGDPHIGMLAHASETGDHFDTKIACRELLCCIRELVDGMPKCPRIIITNLGDAAHAQDDLARTPGHGHPLDVDGRWPKVLDAIHVVFRGIVDYALTRHEHVEFRNLPGNHDPRLAAELMFWLRAVYEKEPRVTIADAFAAHQYDHFGCNLFGWHHGDQSKKADLPALMAADHDGSGTGLWGVTDEHVWHVGHEHHTTVLETPSCFVWVHNTLAGRDKWHAGRYRAKRMLRGFTYHREYGEDRITTVSLARVRAALKAGK